MKRDFDSGYDRPSKRMRPGDECIRLLIPSKVAGSIIGKGGKNITELRGKYKASITVPDCPGPERVLTISADQETALNIVADCLPNMLENGSRVNDDEIDVRMAIHQSQAGCVIGKGGSKIKELREKTGGKLKLFSSCAPQSTDRICQIIGKPSVIIELIRDILDLLHDTACKGPIQNYDPHNFDNYYADEYGGYGGTGAGRIGGRGGGGPRGGGMPPGGPMGGMRGGPPMRGGPGGPAPFNGPPSRGGPNMGPSGPGGPVGPMGGYNMRNGSGPAPFERDGWVGGPGSMNPPFGGPGGPMGGMNGPPGPSGPGSSKTSTQVTIPKDLAGAIIGKQGGRIKKIRNDSGAAITIDEPAAGSNDRVITITGYPNEIQMAQYLLQQSVQAEMQTRRFKK